MKSNKSRVDDERKEGLETIDNEGASASKFQKSQQVNNTSEAEKTEVPKSGFDVSKIKHHGASLKQEVASEIVQNKDYLGPSAGAGIAMRSFRGVSGSSGGILGASNATPEASKSRSDTRYGKKMDRIATKLNYVPSEQVLVEYDEAPSLAESRDSTVGYNGTYRNEFARSQKGSGAVPADLMYDRSVDILMRDELYYSLGQHVNQVGVTNKDTPTVSAVPNPDAAGEYYYPAASNYSVKRGNYLNRKMEATLDNGGKVISMGFNTVDVSTVCKQDIVNQSGANALIDRNVAELDREAMDTKAGDEKADLWSPIPRAIKEPTQVVGYMRDLEAMTGAEIFLNYKKATSSMSFQLNRSVKDGQEMVRPAVEAFRGMHEEQANSSAYDSYSATTGIFTADEYKKGSAALLIGAYDTTSKYNNKADFLLQPRGLRMHLQTADNNMNPFRVKKQFVDAVNGREVFSTIDREYDPMLPVCMSDKAAIIHPYDFNKLYAFIRPFKVDTVTSSSASVTKTIIPSNTASKFTDKYLLYKVLSGSGNPSASSGVITQAASTTVSYIIADSSSVTGYTSLGTLGAGNLTGDIKIAGYGAVVAVDGDKIFMTNAGPYSYYFANLRNNYKTTVEFPLLAGLVDYLESGAGLQFNRSTLLAGAPLVVDMIASTQYFSLWSFLLCAATPYIITARIQSMRDVIYYENNVEYPFSQLIPIADAPIKANVNYKYVDYDSPLECGVMSPEVALTWYLPEFFWNVSADDVFSSTASTGASEGDDTYALYTNSSGSSEHVYIYKSTGTDATVAYTASTSHKAVVTGTGKVTLRVTTSSTAPSGFTLVDDESIGNGVTVYAKNGANYALAMSSTAVCPWYFNEKEFTFSANGVSRSQDESAFSMPSIRSGSRLSFLDNVYGMAPKDLLLSLDRLVDVQAYAPGATSEDDALYPAIVANDSDNGVYKYGLTTDGQPFFTFEDGLTLAEFLRLPRMQGWVVVAPLGALTPAYAALAGGSTDVLNGTCYRIKYFTGSNIQANEYGSFTTTNRSAGVNINRAANFKQVWHQAFADGVTISYDYGMLFGTSDLFRPVHKSGSQVTTFAADAAFAPFVNPADGNKTNTRFKVLSMQKAFWTRLQKLPFVISPFDGFNAVGATPSNVDIYDFAYMFGLCGFRAADYREEVYNREKQVVNQGRLFVSDPFVDESPVFKHGAAVSDLSNSKGYEFSQN